MRARLLQLHCEQHPKGLQYFLTCHADVSQSGSAYGGLGKIRVSKRTVQMLLRWDTAKRVGSQEFLASITVAIP